MTNKEIENALHAVGPAAEIVPGDRIYEWLIGSWTARVVDYADDGSQIESMGEWHFGYVLEGRAVQDVFVVPNRAQRNTETPKARNRYGSSIRSFHPAKREWTVTWINPVSGAHNVLTARREGSKIVQEGRDDNGSTIRWCFTDIEENSAKWSGERSWDGGQTWILEAEFFLTRED